jgi:hypothetical protein
MSNNQTPSAGSQVVNAVKFLADISIMPGSGQIVEGNVGSGLVYGAAGWAAKVIGGPLLWLGVGLDSYSMSASGRHLWELFSTSEKTPQATAEPVQTLYKS